MFLAVLATNLEAQKHDADSRLDHGCARSLVGTTGVSSTSALHNQALVAINRPENHKNRVGLVKSGYGGFGGAKMRPREHLERQVDGRRVESVHGVIKINAEGIFRIEPPCFNDQ